MADATVPPPAPPSVQIPSWVVTLLQLAGSLISSKGFHTVLTAILSAIATLQMAKWQLPSIPEQIRPILPFILPKPKKADDAISQVIFGKYMCSATTIGPVATTDAKIDILTAAHCCQKGAVGTMIMKDGRRVRVTCVSRDSNADAAWLQADNPGGDVPYLYLADGPPHNGATVWHQGYGRDKPGNRESGYFRAVAKNGAQLQFALSVSPGDSGGGIVLDSEGKVLSPVCCTTHLSGFGNVWGASPMAAASIRPARTAETVEPPLVNPILELNEPVVPPPPPVGAEVSSS